MITVRVRPVVTLGLPYHAAVVRSSSSDLLLLGIRITLLALLLLDHPTVWHLVPAGLKEPRAVRLLTQTRILNRWLDEARAHMAVHRDACSLSLLQLLLLALNEASALVSQPRIDIIKPLDPVLQVLVLVQVRLAHIQYMVSVVHFSVLLAPVFNFLPLFTTNAVILVTTAVQLVVLDFVADNRKESRHESIGLHGVVLLDHIAHLLDVGLFELLDLVLLLFHVVFAHLDVD